MFHQFKPVQSANANQPVQHEPSQTELIKESRRHYLRYLATLEDLVKCEIEIKRIESESLAIFLMPSPEYQLLQYKKEIAEFAIRKYQPIITSMANIAMMPIDENPFTPSMPSAPESTEFEEIPLAPTPPSSSATVSAGNAVKERKRSNSF